MTLQSYAYTIQNQTHTLTITYFSTRIYQSIIHNRKEQKSQQNTPLLPIPFADITPRKIQTCNEYIRLVDPNQNPQYF
jgi:hypothetical protein